MQNIQELFEALLAGKQVRYKTWDTDFYVYLENGILYREDRNIFSGYFTIDPEYWEEFFEGITNKPKVKQKLGPIEVSSSESLEVKSNNIFTK